MSAPGLVAGHPLALWLALCLASLLAGCATQSEGPVDKALEWVGLRKPEAAERAKQARDLAEAALQPRKVTLRIHAGEVLNIDGSGRSLAVVTRIYRLRSAASFQQLPYESFNAAEPERDSPLRKDVIGVQEVVLAPGQRHESVESLPPDVTHLAVVALFRSPAPQRWRFVFDSATAAQTGITLGVHGCALSVGAGEALNAPSELRRVAGVRCT